MDSFAKESKCKGAKIKSFSKKEKEKSSASADRKNASTDESTYLIPKEDGERVG